MTTETVPAELCWAEWAELPPGPELGFRLAMVDLAALPDDELTGVMAAARRQTSWAQSVELASVAELARRRQAEESLENVRWTSSTHERLVDEVAAELTVPSGAAQELVWLAEALTERHLRTWSALVSGLIDYRRAKVVVEVLDGLDDELADRIESKVIADAPSQTVTRLRALLKRAVKKADPAAAEEKKKAARRERRVEMWENSSGTADLVGRDLAAEDVEAIMNRLSAVARAMRADGDQRPVDAIRADLYRDLLRGVPLPEAARVLYDDGSTVPAEDAAPGEPSATEWDAASGEPSVVERDADPGAPSATEQDATPGGPSSVGQDAAPGKPPVVGRDVVSGEPFADATGAVGTVSDADAGAERDAASGEPFADATGAVGTVSDADAGAERDAASGEPFADAADAVGTVSDADAGAERDAASGEPSADAADAVGTVSDADDVTVRPAARREARTPNGKARTPTYDEAVAEVERLIAEALATELDRHLEDVLATARRESRDGERPVGRALLVSQAVAAMDKALEGLRDTWCAATGQQAHDGYRPPAAMRRRIERRHRTCVFPTCNRRVVACDVDHTRPYDPAVPGGGRTRADNLAPLCRRHHRTKQHRTWWLVQPFPGLLVWITPAGHWHMVLPSPPE
ncbi:HNH endonuclease signature motif containing protein [Actinomadura alba]|uniref:HNH endonuclease signature motif containing protein n=1 Tax=Actinomadura alba TaxID=406431 RepID=UPI0031E2DAF6